MANSDGEADEQQLKTLISKRGYLKGNLTRIDKSLKDKTALGDLSKEALLVKETRLTNLFKEYENVCMEISTLTSYDKEPIDEQEERYLQNLTLLHELINLKTTSHQSNPDSQTRNVKTKLPVITIPIFSGKTGEYKTFIGLFESLIHNDKTIDSIQKLYYLRNFVQGEPHDLIKNLPLVGESYTESLDILRERYDNKYCIISDHVNTLLDMPSITKSTACNIRNFVCVVKQQLGALKNLQLSVDTWDPILVCILTRKLDLYSNREYQMLRQGNELSIKGLIDFLEKRAMALENTESSAHSGTSSQPGQRMEHGATARLSKSAPAAVNSVIANNPPAAISCIYCKSAHKLYSCPEFLKLSSTERTKFAGDKKLCNICLNLHTKKCRFFFKCGICKKKHHTLLHEEETTKPSVTMVTGASPSQILLPTVQVRVYASDGTEVLAKALLDSGSQTSFVTTDLVNQLGLKPKTINKGIIGIGNAHSSINQSVQLTVHSKNSSYSMPMNCYVIEQITSKLPQQQINIDDIKIPAHLSLADTTFDTPSNIQILMAADVFFQILLPQPDLSQETPARRSPATTSHASSPSFLNTKFGYVIAGTFSNQCHNEQLQKESISLFCQSCDLDTDNLISNLWKFDTVPEIFPEKNPEFEQSELIFQQGVVFKDKQFQVDLPLKVPLDQINDMLGDSQYLAMKRFQNLENKLHKNPDLYEQYKAFIDEYVALGHGTYIDIDKYDLTSDPVYFLPHHAVLRPDKKTTKCRVVFDGSMLTNKRRSLNDLLLNGPIVQRELLDILLLFRLGSYVFSTDLKNMFRSIYLDPKYRSLQLILWRENPNEKMRCIQLNTVTYGFKCSTFLATRCLIELALRYQVEFPLASFVLQNQTYCDDILVASSSLESLMEVKAQLLKLLDLGGFQAHKWSSNCDEILLDIPHDKRHFDEVDIQKQNYYLKTLGVTYNTNTDTFKIASPSPNEVEPRTKREIVSYVAKFYDPLGLAGPITVTAKSFIQRLWTAKLDWDSHLPDDLNNQWLEFYKSLLLMKPIHVNRNATVHDAAFIQLLGYADAASSTAYGCCLYLRVVDHNGDAKITLLCSKSRLVPLNDKCTTPRLELNAALLLAKLAQRVHLILSIKLKIDNILLFSDSQIVLAWLKIDITRLNVYVANRVKVILACTENCSWHYINTGENPADCLSRGLKPHELENHELWWQGPRNLRSCKYAPDDINIKNLPQNLPDVKVPDAEQSCSSTMVCSNNDNTLCLDFLKKYSSINRMQRVLSYVRRFCNNLKSHLVKNKLDYITSVELNEALLLIVKYEQQKQFSEQMKLLSQGKSVVGSLKSLNPFIDGSGLLRVGGRLDCATIPHSQKHPIVLPNNSDVTKLIVLNEHVKNLHAGQKLLLSTLNQKFWLINGIKEIKKIIHSCVTCFRLKAQTAKQLMGSLPQDRVNVSRPFQKVGIDYAGPISVKQARIRRPVISTGYICVYVCFSTKAIHLELASSLTTAAFLACFKRFIARRGLPSDVYCDNASTFKGARNQLDELYKLQNSADHQRQVQFEVAQQGIKFHFIPSYSPVFGGLWEAAVKSTKYHLKRVILKALLTYEELNTVLNQIESMLNSRPLTPISTDINDYSYLTPGHFLIGAALNTYPEQNISDVPINRLKFWNICCSMFQQFWKIWSKSYLNVLQCRPKWKDSQPNIQIGSLVILREDDLQPLHWPMARVVNVFPGTDGKVRAVEVRTQNGKTHRRSVTKVCLLPIDAS